MIINNQTEAIEFFKKTTLNIHCMERFLQTSELFKGKPQPFKSAVLQTAFNEMRYARMFSGDCLRMLVLGENARNTDVRFNPADYGAVCDDAALAVYVKELTVKPKKKKYDDNGDIIRKEKPTPEPKLTPQELELKQINEFKAFLRGRYYEYTDLSVNNLRHYSLEMFKEFNFYKDQMQVALKKADMNLGLRIQEIYAENTENV